MKILVVVKRVIDYNVQVRVKEDGTGVHTDNVKMATNPPDDNAVEEAVKIKESGKATEVIVVTIGNEKAQESVRKALAVGADRGIHIITDSNVEPLGAAKILKKIVEKEKPEFLRIYVQGGGCSGLSYGMGFEKAAEEDDLTIEENGVKVLVDSMSQDHLQGANVDYIESLMGSGFKINNPNVTKSCSCGSSFSTE